MARLIKRSVGGGGEGGGGGRGEREGGRRRAYSQSCPGYPGLILETAAGNRDVLHSRSLPQSYEGVLAANYPTRMTSSYVARMWRPGPAVPHGTRRAGLPRRPATIASCPKCRPILTARSCGIPRIRKLSSAGHPESWPSPFPRNNVYPAAATCRSRSRCRASFSVRVMRRTQGSMP